MNNKIVILDLGCQFTPLIERVILSLGYQCIILKPADVGAYMQGAIPRGIILSGGDASVYDKDAPRIPEEILAAGCPILGICYGMQAMVFKIDNSLVKGHAKAKEYGIVDVVLEKSLLFKDLPATIKVLANHGDAITAVPPGYRIIAQSKDAIQGIESDDGKIMLVQFHPEVEDTEDDNKILSNFLEVCDGAKDLVQKNVIKDIGDNLVQAVGEGIAGVGVSGGVDSMTAAILASQRLNDDQLFCFFIDTGGLRLNEREEVEETCKKVGIRLHVIDASDVFFRAMKIGWFEKIRAIFSSYDPFNSEIKRIKRFQKTYEKVFDNIIKDNGITHFIQGTLAPDMLESGHKGQAAVIKTHHNVSDHDFGVIKLHPFGHLFKDQVRSIARELNLPESVSERKPFPGPGLFIRIMGMEVTRKRVEKLQKADALVTNILKEEGLYKDISQIIVAMPGVKTVGVQGSARSYTHPLVIRCVSSTTYMTAKAIMLPPKVRERLNLEISKTGFNRIWFDETNKPPASVEME